MTKNRRTLLACWEDEVDQLSKIIKQHDFSGQHVDAVVFSESGHSLSSVLLPVEAAIVSLPPSQFTQREPLLKAPSELALWLFDNALSYQNIICSVRGGLVYFVAHLNMASNQCSHWTVNTFSASNTRSVYRHEQRFLDTQGVLRNYLELHWNCGIDDQSEVSKAQINNAGSVTVIVPFHNRTAFIAQALTSLLEQTIQGMQVLIVNDGSDIGCRQALGDIVCNESFCELAIKIIDVPVSVGAAGARNIGLSNVNTPFVLFLDDDDVFAPRALELCLEAQWRTNCDIVTMAFSYFDGETYPVFSETPGMMIHFHSDQDWVSALSYNCIGGISALYRTEVITRHGGFECGPFAGEEDWQLLLKLAIEGYKTINLPLPLLWYRDTPFSLSKKMLHFDSRHQLFELFEKTLPPQLKVLPEYLSSQIQAQKSSGNEIPFARLGFQLGQCTDRSIYIYGAGQIGKQVMTLLEKLNMDSSVVGVIDRNAAYIQSINNMPVVTLEECQIVDNAVVVVASLSFIDEIVNQFDRQDLKLIRLDKL